MLRLGLILLLLNALAGFSRETIVVSNSEVQLIGLETSSLEDKEGELTYKTAISKLNEFDKGNSEVFFDYAKPSTYWVTFSLINQSGVDLWMDIGNSNLTYINLYKLNDQFELIDSVNAGCLSTVENNSITGYTFKYPLLLREETEKYHFLISIKTNLVFEVPIFVGGVTEIITNRNKYDYISIFVIGAFILLFLYNSFIYLITRDRIYVYYSLYLLSAVVTGSYLNNFPFIEKIIGKTIAHVYLDTWLWTIFVFTGLFTIRYFDLKKIDRLFYRIIVLFIGIFILFGVLNLFIPLPYLANIFQVVAAVFYFTCLVFSYRLLIRGVKRARLYCLGWTFMMTGAIIYILVYNGWLPHNYITRNVSYFGAAMEVLIFSIALGRRINDLQRKQLKLNARLRQKNERLLDLNDSLDSFNYHVSHDLKTVLNNTTSLSRMAKKYNLKKDHNRVDEIISKLELIAANGTETVQSFLSLGKIDTMIDGGEAIEINLVDELNAVLEVNHLNDQLKIEIVTNEIHHIKMHTRVFRSIFLNFFTNSIKYNERAPQAKIRFMDHADNYVFEYKDNGIGIDLTKYKDDIFKPFQRVANKLSKEGTGVGLYLVRRLVNGLGGEIDVESTLGLGTTFIIKLPKDEKELDV